MSVLPYAVASVPLLAWATDSLGCLHRIRSDDMEPTLKKGDVVWVRKADGGNLFQWGTGSDDDRGRIQRHEAMNAAYGPTSILYSHPPLALPGDVVLYRSLEKYRGLCVHRVAGVGGQWLRQPWQGGSSSSMVRRSGLRVIPTYAMWVHGDNAQKSRDSRDLGPVSRGLLVGIVERVVWPPSRWQALQREPTIDDRTKRPIAFWP